MASFLCSVGPLTIIEATVGFRSRLRLQLASPPSPLPPACCSCCFCFHSPVSLSDPRRLAAQARRALAMAGGRGDAASMIAVGLVWGATNALMRRGALVWDRRARASPSGGNVFRRWAALLLTWQYSAPFASNLCASAAFFALLGAAPISVAVPVTNAVTFAATAAAAAALGERVRLGPAVLGTALIVLGVSVCIS
ncbi:uncharacterized protein [Miscanthus floridulus]|uniref:uncharacterized protein n=1 Tax=Miscanthus floridulus TaxID=154761 RepID=UPI0034581CE6